MWGYLPIIVIYGEREMLNIEHVKAELGSQVVLADVAELYPEMKKKDISQMGN